MTGMGNRRLRSLDSRFPAPRTSLPRSFFRVPEPVTYGCTNHDNAPPELLIRVADFVEPEDYLCLKLSCKAFNNNMPRSASAIAGKLIDEYPRNNLHNNIYVDGTTLGERSIDDQMIVLAAGVRVHISTYKREYGHSSALPKPHDLYTG